MRRLLWSSPSTRAVLLLLAIMILALVLGAALLLVDLHKREVEHAKSEIVGFSRVLGDQTTRSFEGSVLAMRSAHERLSDSLVQHLELTSAPVKTLLKARVAGLPQLRSLFIIGPDGDLLNSSLADLSRPMNLADRDYFQYYARGGSEALFISAPLHSRIDQEWTLFISSLLLDERNRFRGVLVASIRLDFFESLYSRIGLDSVDQIQLLDRQGRLIAGFPHQEDSLGHAVNAPTRNLVAQPAGEQIVETTMDGTPIFAAFQPVAKFPFVIGVAVTENHALGPWRQTARPVVIGVGATVLLILLAAASMLRNLRRREELAGALQERDERLRQLVQSVRDAIITVDAEASIILFNQAAEEMFKVDAAEAVGATLGSLLTDESLRRYAAWLESGEKALVRDSGASACKEIVGIRKGGQCFPLEVSFSSVSVLGERYFTLVLRDITDRCRAEKELRDTNLQLKELTAALQAVREEERTAIAREMHDELGQLLTGIKYELSWLERRLPVENTEFSAKLQVIKEQLNTTIGSVRRITTELRPLILDDLGLTAAMRWLADEFFRRTGVLVTLELPETDPQRGGATATALFRVTQESLTNIAKYALATEVSICLEKREHEWQLSIRDNGNGFAVDVKRLSGFGLIGMRERALMLGGHFDVSSAPGRGTRTTMVVPAEE